MALADRLAIVVAPPITEKLSHHLIQTYKKTKCVPWSSGSKDIQKLRVALVLSIYQLIPCFFFLDLRQFLAAKKKFYKCSLDRSTGCLAPDFVCYRTKPEGEAAWTGTLKHQSTSICLIFLNLDLSQFWFTFVDLVFSRALIFSPLENEL